jgi:hypothetical protein
MSRCFRSDDIVRLALDCRDRSVSKLYPVAFAVPPSSHYRGRNRPIDLREALDLAGASQVIHGNIQRIVHHIVEIADGPWVHDDLRGFLGNKNVVNRSSVPSQLPVRLALGMVAQVISSSVAFTELVW